MTFRGYRTGPFALRRRTARMTFLLQMSQGALTSLRRIRPTFCGMKTVQNLTPVTPRRRVAHVPLRCTVRRPQAHIPRRIAVRGAYTLLAAISIWTLLLDSYSRRDSGGTPPFNANPATESAAPFPMTPLAESPFPRKSDPSAIVSSLRVVPAREIALDRDKRSAPTGVLFLRVPVHVQTTGGEKSFNAGTQVRVVRNQAGKIRVSHDGTEFFVEEWQVSREPDRVEGFARTAS